MSIFTHDELQARVASHTGIRLADTSIQYVRRSGLWFIGGNGATELVHFHVQPLRGAIHDILKNDYPHLQHDDPLLQERVRLAGAMQDQHAILRIMGHAQNVRDMLGKKIGALGLLRSDAMEDVYLALRVATARTAFCANEDDVAVALEAVE